MGSEYFTEYGKLEGVIKWNLQQVLMLALLVLFTGCAPHLSQDKDIITIGVRADVPLVAYYTLERNRAGSEIELAKKLAEYLGKKVKFITVTSKNREKTLLNGKVDMIIATFSITKERSKRMLFSIPYHIDHQGVMVSTNRDISSIDDLQGMKIGVIKGANSIQRVSQRLPSTHIVKFDDYYRAMITLSLGDIDAISTDISILKGLNALWSSPKKLETIDKKLTFLVDPVQNQDDQLYKILKVHMSKEQYGIALRPEDHELLQHINLYLTKLQKKI